MDVSLDTAVIEKATANAVEQAFVSSMQGYEVRNQISKAVGDEIARADFVGQIGLALRAAFEKQSKVLVERLADELVRHTASCIGHVLEENFVDLVAKIRTGEGYITSEDKKKLRAEIRAEWRGEKKELLVEEAPQAVPGIASDDPF